MKKAKTPHQPLTPRWIPLSVIGGILVFAGFAAYQMVSAQTSAFTNPTCDPTTSTNCNKAAPLFLSPADRSITQVVETPVSIGNRGTCQGNNTKYCNTASDCGGAACNPGNAAKDISLFGNLTLSQSGKRIQTAASFTGQAINVSTTDDFAIVAKSTRTSTNPYFQAAIQGNGDGDLPGVWATSTTGSALWAVAGTSFGQAATFIGPVRIRNAANQEAILTVGESNNLLVNGFPAAGAQKAITITGATGIGSVYQYNLKPTLVDGTNYYPVTSVQVLYRNASSKDYWRALDTLKINYKECLGGEFNGVLELTNPADTQDYRIYIGYDATTPIICTGADTTAPTDVSIAGVTSNYWYTGNVTLTGIATELSGSGITSMNFYDTVAGVTTLLNTSPVLCTSGCNVANKTLTYSWNAGAAASTWIDGTKTHSLSVKATSAGGTSDYPLNPNATILTVKTFTTADGRQACSPPSLTCTTAEFCCSAGRVNDGKPICSDSAAPIPTCTISSARCGSCSATP